MIQRILKNKNSPSETAFNMNLTGHKIISQGKKAKALLVVLFLVFGGLVFLTDVVQASGCDGFNIEDTTNSKGVFPNGEFLCTCTRSAVGEKGCVGFSVKTSEECSSKATTVKEGTKYNAVYGQCYFKGDTLASQKANGGGETVQTNKNITNGLNPAAAAEGIKEVASNTFVKGLKWILVGVLNVVGWIFAIAATLFAWVVDPVNVSGDNGMLNKQAVKDVWVMVRDLLNMGFIMVLLFAAFGTIFQVDSLNLKKVWLNILINALLVNFSFPIARFIIDISNVAFYYLLNNLFSPSGTTTVTGSSIFASFGAASQIGELLAPGNYANYDIAYLIAMIVIVFIMGMTLLIIAALFMVRLIVLTMLVMFSPIGFVGYILPATKKHAQKWWDQLLEYSFFAPIMIFIMAIALRIVEVVGKENFNSFKANAQANAMASDANWVSQAAFFAIPVIILWAGIGMAKKSGVAGAGMVTGTVTKWGKKLANSPLGLGKYAWKQSGIPGGVKKGWENSRKSGKIFGIENGLTRFALKNERESRESLIAGGFGNRTKGWNNAQIEMERTQANEQRKKWKDQGGATDADLQSALTGNNMAKAKAAALELAEKNGIKNLAQYQAAAGVVDNDPVLKGLFKDKSKEKHIKFAIETDISNSEKKMSQKFGRPLSAAEQKKIRDAAYEKHLAGMTGDALSKQKKLLSSDDFHEHFMNKRKAGGSKEDKAFIAKTASKLSPSDRQNWRKRGYSV